MLTHTIGSNHKQQKQVAKKTKKKLLTKFAGKNANLGEDTSSDTKSVF